MEGQRGEKSQGVAGPKKAVTRSRVSLPEILRKVSMSVSIISSSSERSLRGSRLTDDSAVDRSGSTADALCFCRLSSSQFKSLFFSLMAGCGNVRDTTKLSYIQHNSGFLLFVYTFGFTRPAYSLAARLELYNT
jgi:hypothetical protein